MLRIQKLTRQTKVYPLQSLHITNINTLYITFTQHFVEQQFAFVVVSVQLLSHVSLFMTLWTVVCQAPLFLESSRQEY